MTHWGEPPPEDAPDFRDVPEVVGFVRTVKNRCRICYTCVRMCPAKAIRISRSQAEVVPERCIGCGNCIRVCSQQAKQVVSTLDQVDALLMLKKPVLACLAPSFPVELYAQEDYRVLVGMIRALGFAKVVEVAFGADLVADRYRRMISANPRKQYIATTCPAIVGFVERYHPEQIPHLAPIVSPMVALSRALKSEDPGIKVVFIGPCVSKKVEACDPNVAGVPDVAITFRELQHLLQRYDIRPDAVRPTDFDPPHPSLGSLFPMPRGFLQAAAIQEDLLAIDVVATDGLKGFTSVLEEFTEGTLEARLVEMLSCHGCIAGPGVTTHETLYRRRARVSHHARHRSEHLDAARWRESMERFQDLDLTRTFSSKDQRLTDHDEIAIRKIMFRMGKFTKAQELDCGACGYRTCHEHAQAIDKGFAESEMCLPFVIDEHLNTIRKLSLANEKLASAQETLMHQERLASMGQLAAGVAHEINNPLGVVLMYTHLMLDECTQDSPMREDLSMIAEQANRCKRIVAGLLDFARQNKVAHQPTDMDELVRSSLSNVRTPENIRVLVEHGEGSSMAEVDRDQMMQVLINLVGNAYDAMPDGGSLQIRTWSDPVYLHLEVKDSGLGIPRENLPKLFEPFFTTKLMGKGTGLGLAVVFGIVKLHRGDIVVESNTDASVGPRGTIFRIKLPRTAAGNGSSA
jgi:two-component system NtrC family sensor kinase